MFNKVILIIGAGPNQLPAINLAKQRGYYVVSTDMDPEAEGFLLSDQTGLVSTRDIEGTIAFAKRIHKQKPIDGVMTMASESAMTIAGVAEALELPGITPTVAENATNKVKRQLLFKENGVSSPQFSFACGFDEACREAQKIGWPVVVKPADSAGSRGVQKVDSPEDMKSALDEISSVSTLPQCLIEEYLSGTEHSIEGIVLEGRVIWAGLSDRNYAHKHAYPPYFLEDGDTMPSNLGPETIKEVKAEATKAVHALGIDWGPVKGDIIIDPQKGIRVLEMAARLSGDYFCYETIPLHNGINLLEATMDLSVGFPVSPEALKPKHNQGVALRYVWPKPGRVVSIEGFEEARSIPGVDFVQLEPRWRNLSMGTVIPAPTFMGERIASVMAFADTRDEAVAIAEKAVSTVKIRT
ncbi:ATP-grasp domain-containing protein [Desulfohalobium retbaense]|uniref:Phosphoribosylglycinamide synthetase n=1 Tax=Desulfohalobium retbaense (strain ATCC 49708 / DSM 5692 / JCM 16813 / HR100) TaxID=485915 RepID=C8WZ00_DESRD|nr:ATP-grasp domain-containing protein [Desulfohalobium retbaense]ACV67916.1 phosphoribosylglycinamide synthetase [Desulfohalobium retbaense DSM 5692]